MTIKLWTIDIAWNISDITKANKDWGVLINSSVNGVTLTDWGSATNFLNEEWNYVEAGGWGWASFSGINGQSLMIAWEVNTGVVGQLVPFADWNFAEIQISSDNVWNWDVTITVKLNWTAVWSAVITTGASATNWRYIALSTDLTDAYVIWDNVTVEVSWDVAWMVNLLINII